MSSTRVWNDQDQNLSRMVLYGKCAHTHINQKKAPVGVDMWFHYPHHYANGSPWIISIYRYCHLIFWYSCFSSNCVFDVGFFYWWWIELVTYCLNQAVPTMCFVHINIKKIYIFMKYLLYIYICMCIYIYIYMIYVYT